jgi:hypothetical protein
VLQPVVQPVSRQQTPVQWWWDYPTGSPPMGLDLSLAFEPPSDGASNTVRYLSEPYRVTAFQ